MRYPEPLRLAAPFAVALCCAGTACDRTDALSWVSRERYDVDYRFYDSVDQMPAPVGPELDDPESWSMVVFSDLHSWEEVPITLSELESYLEENPVDLLVQLGDVTESGWARQLDSVAAAFSRLSAPVYSTVGNHDVWHEGWPYYRAAFGPSVYELHVGNGLLIVLDTGGGALGSPQRRWLGERLERGAADHEHVIVLTHYPLWPGSRSDPHELGSQEAVYDLIDLLRSHGVDAHVGGHTHVWARTSVDGLDLITLCGMGESSGDRCVLRVEVSHDRLLLERVPMGGMR